MPLPDGRRADQPELAEIRETRRVLRHEVTQIARWRRLLRARLDLTVARAVLPEQLGGEAAQYLADDVTAPVVPYSHLVSITRGSGEAFPVDDIARLRSADASLAEYEGQVRAALMVATDLLVERLSQDPTFLAVEEPTLTS